MDNDDSMKEDCIEMLLSRILETDADMVMVDTDELLLEEKF